MHKQYAATQTIHVTVTLTDTEEEIIEIARKEPIGVYWEENDIRNPYTLNEILTLQRTLETTLDAGIFTPTGKEEPADVPGSGELAEPAKELHEALTAILTDWNHTD